MEYVLFVFLETKPVQNLIKIVRVNFQKTVIFNFLFLVATPNFELGKQIIVKFQETPNLIKIVPRFQVVENCKYDKCQTTTVNHVFGFRGQKNEYIHTKTDIGF